MNKKGAEMTIGTIIVIVLALVVLVVIIFGFTQGWTKLWESINIFGGGTTNVQTIVDSCKIACSRTSNYDYCERPRDVNFEYNGKIKTARVTCGQLKIGGTVPAVKPAGENVVLPTVEIDCNMECGLQAFMNCQEGLNAKECPTIAGQVNKCHVRWVNQDQLNLDRQNNIGTGKTYASVTPLDISLVTDVQDRDTHSGQVCVKYIDN